ncbi:sulfate adenylyltransferase subunit CysD [Sanyastnella coralliicola]|uniref:sulfate adenylyltransferase subunit CysD n=1 Tax=Sanyastnella coralliicola TaxID=3069118 RepID=UPI0027B89442|nr:sulfate adenylyltransferase subunit CysD [Longitalea sp. SCSIO 12813]
MKFSDFPRSLENEAIYIFRETLAQFERPVLLFSGGKDSITLVHLMLRAFHPLVPPIPLLHIDTGHNFPEALRFRDELVEKYQLTLHVRKVEDTIREKGLQEETGKYASRNALQAVTLLDAIEEFKFDACIGGARRDEEKARAKERIFSVRNDFGEWDSRRQRPEVFDILNGRIHPGENVRVFPISNWTELDVWNYIREEGIALPSLYFAHEREVFYRDGLIWPVSDFVRLSQDESPERKVVRFRTVGDMTCTAAVDSQAATIDLVMEEIAAAEISERGARIDDKRSEAAMELRKQNGYF